MAIANPHGLRGYLDAIADVNTLSAPQRPFDVQGALRRNYVTSANAAAYPFQRL